MPDEPGRFDGPDRFDPPSGGFGPGASGAAGPEDPRLAAALMQLRVLTGALASSVVIYAGVAWFVTSGSGAGGDQPARLPLAVIGVLAALALFDLVVAPLIERHLAGGGGGGDLDAALATYRRAKIVGFAFREAAAVLGLLITLFTGNPLWCFALVAATLVAMAVAWPSRDELMRVVRGASQPG